MDNDVFFNGVCVFGSHLACTITSESQSLRSAPCKQGSGGTWTFSARIFCTTAKCSAICKHVMHKIQNTQLPIKMFQSSALNRGLKLHLLLKKSALKVNFQNGHMTATFYSHGSDQGMPPALLWSAKCIKKDETFWLDSFKSGRKECTFTLSLPWGLCLHQTCFWSREKKNSTHWG